MRKLKRTAIALMTASLMLLASCEGGTTSADSSYLSSIYSEYQANGGSLAYDEWYSAIKGGSGEIGKDGSSVLSGHGAPAASLGGDGDSYIDLDSFDFYTKANGSWSKVGNIKGDSGSQGAEGSDGTSLLNGHGAPATNLGSDGDSYIDLDSFNYYVKTNGTWYAAGNIKGSGISSIQKTSTEGLVDTYTIFYTNGTTSTFTVTNGKDVETEEEEEGSDGLAYYPMDDGTYGVKMGKTNYLSKIVVPETHNGKTVTKILPYAFCSSGNEGIEEISLPKTITEIGEQAFYGCSSLTNLVIPNGVTSIGRFAFCDCFSLEDIAIPSSVTSIGRFAFYGCSGISEMYVSASVTSIGRFAFYGCINLTDIYYEGTSEEWNAVINDSSWVVPSTIIVHCSDSAE